MNNALTPLYVIILNWNLPDETIACIESVQQNDLPEVKVVVVDNGSTDQSVDILKRRFTNRIDLIETGANLGFAAGVNVGVTHALAMGAGSILLLNNDTLIEAKMIAGLLETARSRPAAGLIGPIIYYHQAPTRVWRYADKELPWLPVPLQMSEKELAAKSSRPFQVDYVTACGLLVKREIFETVGLLDSRYFMYFEDADFCRRVRNAGYEIWCVPQAKMWHKVSLSAQKDRPANRYARSWGRIQFHRTHAHGRWPYLFHLYVVLKAVRMTAADILRGDWRLVKPLWQGTFHGYRDDVNS